MEPVEAVMEVDGVRHDQDGGTSGLVLCNATDRQPSVSDDAYLW